MLTAEQYIAEVLTLVGDQTTIVITDAEREPLWQDRAAPKPAVIVVTAAEITEHVATIPTGCVVVLDHIDFARHPAVLDAITAANPCLIVHDFDRPVRHPSRLVPASEGAPVRVYPATLPGTPASPQRIRDKLELLFRFSPEGQDATRAGAIAELVKDL